MVMPFTFSVSLQAVQLDEGRDEEIVSNKENRRWYHVIDVNGSLRVQICRVLLPYNS